MMAGQPQSRGNLARGKTRAFAEQYSHETDRRSRETSRWDAAVTKVDLRVLLFRRSADWRDLWFNAIACEIHRVEYIISFKRPKINSAPRVWGALE